MAIVKRPKIGVYGEKTRLLQKKLSYERISLNWKTVLVWKYLGSRINATPSIDDIQDPIFLENPDRAYDTEPVEINAYWEPVQEQMMDLSQFGIMNPLGDTQTFRMHSYSFEADGLGRYIIVGDVIEVPFMSIDGKKALFEVTDVDRKKENETYEVIVTTVPMKSRQETVEIDTDNDGAELLEDLLGRIEDVYDDVSEEGFDTSEIAVDNASDVKYDPRPNYATDFLDDPSKPLF